MFHVISARCVARDLLTTAPWPLERTGWRQFAAQWGDCEKSRIAPLNVIIISINISISTVISISISISFSISTISFSISISISISLSISISITYHEKVVREYSACSAQNYHALLMNSQASSKKYTVSNDHYQALSLKSNYKTRHFLHGADILYNCSEPYFSITATDEIQIKVRHYVAWFSQSKCLQFIYRLRARVYWAKHHNYINVEIT